MTPRLIIAIDGPAASGKTTVARRVADLLGYTYLDSGAMYRAVAWKALRDGVPLDSPGRLEQLASHSRIDLVRMGTALRVIMDGEDITERIRSPAVAQAASHVAVIPGVRTVLVAQQRRAGAAGGVVMEGRDIGTVVFPHAALKIFSMRRWRRGRTAAGRSIWTRENHLITLECWKRSARAIAATASAPLLRWSAPVMPYLWTTRPWIPRRRRA